MIRKILPFLKLGFASGLSALLAFLVQALLARELSAADYGRFSSGLSLVTIMSPMACFGIGSFWLRVFGKEGWYARRWVRNSLVYILISALLVLTSLAIWAHFGPHDQRTEMVILALLAFVLSQIVLELMGVVFQLEENYNHFSFLQFSPHLARAILLVIFLIIPVFESYFLSTLVAYFSVSAIVVLVGIAILHKHLAVQLALKGHGPEPETEGYSKYQYAALTETVRESLPFGVVGFSYLLYVQMNVVLVKYWGSDEQAAYYNVAFLVINAFLLLPNIAFEKILIPKMHRWYYQDPVLLRSVIKWSAALFAVISVCGVGVIYLAMDLISNFFFEETPQSLSVVLVLLMWTIPLRSLSLCFGAVLFVGGHVNLRVKMLSVAIFINLLSCYIFIPESGGAGAASAMLLADASMCFLFFLGMLKVLREGERMQ